MQVFHQIYVEGEEVVDLTSSSPSASSTTSRPASSRVKERRTIWRIVGTTRTPTSAEETGHKRDPRDVQGSLWGGEGLLLDRLHFDAVGVGAAASAALPLSIGGDEPVHVSLLLDRFDLDAVSVGTAASTALLPSIGGDGPVHYSASMTLWMISRDVCSGEAICPMRLYRAWYDSTSVLDVTKRPAPGESV